MSELIVENVSFAYGKENIIEDIRLELHDHELVSLLGASGGGKTTCASLAARFYEPDAGRITVGGVDISTVDPEVLLSDFSIVFQDVVLFNASIMENIRIGKKDATDEEVMRAAQMAFCDEFVREMPDGYQTVIGENGSRLRGSLLPEPC